jgi:hypothetical protein
MGVESFPLPPGFNNRLVSHPYHNALAVPTSTSCNDYNGDRWDCNQSIQEFTNPTLLLSVIFYTVYDS